MAKQRNQSDERAQPKHDVVHAPYERVKPSTILDEISHVRDDPVEKPANVNNHVSHI